MRIVGAASAFPKYHYDQKALCEAFLAYWGDRLPEPSVRRVTEAGGGGTFAMDPNLENPLPRGLAASKVVRTRTSRT